MWTRTYIKCFAMFRRKSFALNTFSFQSRRGEYSYYYVSSKPRVQENRYTVSSRKRFFIWCERLMRNVHFYVCDFIRQVITTHGTTVIVLYNRWYGHKRTESSIKGALLPVITDYGPAAILHTNVHYHFGFQDIRSVRQQYRSTESQNPYTYVYIVIFK